MPTLALGSMTWTKGHHNAQTGGGLGWVRPDEQSIAVHYLKTDAAAPWQAPHPNTLTLALTLTWL